MSMRAKPLVLKGTEADITLAHWNLDHYHSKFRAIIWLFGISFPTLQLAS
jgi:hypothetical protein